MLNSKAAKKILKLKTKSNKHQQQIEQLSIGSNNNTNNNTNNNNNSNNDDSKQSSPQPPTQSTSSASSSGVSSSASSTISELPNPQSFESSLHTYSLTSSSCSSSTSKHETPIILSNCSSLSSSSALVSNHHHDPPPHHHHPHPHQNATIYTTITTLNNNNNNLNNKLTSNNNNNNNNNKLAPKAIISEDGDISAVATTSNNNNNLNAKQSDKERQREALAEYIKQHQFQIPIATQQQQQQQFINDKYYQHNNHYLPYAFQQQQQQQQQPNAQQYLKPRFYSTRQYPSINNNNNNNNCNDTEYNNCIRNMSSYRISSSERITNPPIQHIRKTPANKRDESLGICYLIYGPETKRATLPNQVTGIDTVKALFVKAFSEKLTMAYLDDDSILRIYIKDPLKELFYQLDDMSEIKDRCVLKLIELNASLSSTTSLYSQLNSSNKQSISAAQTPTPSTRSQYFPIEQQQPQPQQQVHHQQQQSQQQLDSVIYRNPTTTTLANNTIRAISEPRFQQHKSLSINDYNPNSISNLIETYDNIDESDETDIILKQQQQPKQQHQQHDDYINKNNNNNKKGFLLQQPSSSTNNNHHYHTLNSISQLQQQQQLQQPTFVYDKYLLIGNNKAIISNNNNNNNNSTTTTTTTTNNNNQVNTNQTPIPTTSIQGAPVVKPNNNNKLKTTKLSTNDYDIASLNSVKSNKELTQHHSTDLDSYFNKQLVNDDATNNDEDEDEDNDDDDDELTTTASMSINGDINNGEDNNIFDLLDTNNSSAFNNNDTMKSKHKIKQMQKQLENLTNLVQEAILNRDFNQLDANFKTKFTNQKHQKQQYKHNLSQLFNKTKDLRNDLNSIKKLHENFHSTISDSIKSFVNRLNDQIKSILLNEINEKVKTDAIITKYENDSKKIDFELNDLEIVVDDLRELILKHKCNVNIDDVECYALALSQLSKQLVNLKTTFSNIKDNLRNTEEDNKFYNVESEKLDFIIRRCKRITGILIIFKKLAINAREQQHSKQKQQQQNQVGAKSSPTNQQQKSQSTDDNLTVPIINKNLFKQIEAIKPDHEQRKLAIEESEAKIKKRQNFKLQRQILKAEKYENLNNQNHNTTNNNNNNNNICVNNISSSVNTGTYSINNTNNTNNNHNGLINHNNNNNLNNNNKILINASTNTPQSLNKLTTNGQHFILSQPPLPPQPQLTPTQLKNSLSFLETVHEEDVNEDTNNDVTPTQSQHNSPLSTPKTQKRPTQILINDKKSPLSPVPNNTSSQTTTTTSSTSTRMTPAEQIQLYEQLNQLKPLKVKQYRTSANIYLNNNNDDQYKSDSEAYTYKRSSSLYNNNNNNNQNQIQPSTSSITLNSINESKKTILNNIKFNDGASSTTRDSPNRSNDTVIDPTATTAHDSSSNAKLNGSDFLQNQKLDSSFLTSTTLVFPRRNSLPLSSTSMKKPNNNQPQTRVSLNVTDL